MPPVPPKTEDTPRPRPDRSRDKALLIAIEYKWPIHGSVEVLDSPHSDLFKMRNHLVEDWHYHSDNIVVLKDGPEDEVDPDMIPTRNNILREIDSLVRDIKAGDRRVFFYAGHGYQVKNRRGTERDEKDEAILTAKHNGPPEDTQTYDPSSLIGQGLVIDNELRLRLVRKIPPGAKLVAIADTCHSGTLFDLTWHWHCDTQDNFHTLSSPPLSGKLPSGPTSSGVSKSSRRRRTLDKVKGNASEYTYKSSDIPQDASYPSPGSQHRVNTLFSNRSASWSQEEGEPHGTRAQHTAQSRSNNEAPKCPGSPQNHVFAADDPECQWGLLRVDTVYQSPTEEISPYDLRPHVVSISSAEDDQKAWSRNKEDTMTSLFVELMSTLM
ncbi:peptidase C14, caspase domain-containing protein [Irpex lacteus]|nr:peptidase C14, caspase domain-containing protein [Irpex lacteus]